jgi:outer membrane protein TolC
MYENNTKHHLRRTFILSASLLALALSGCANFGIRPSSEVKIPDQFSKVNTEQDQNKITGDWWKTANDPTLNSVILSIDQDNLSLEQARERLQSARANAGVGAFLPNVTAGGDVQYTQKIKERSRKENTESESENATSSQNTKKSTSYYNVKLDASWELPLYGQAQDALDRKNASIAFAEADIDHIRLSVRAEAIRLYADMRRSKNSLVKRQNIEAAEQQIVTYQNIKHGAGLIDDKEKFDAERSYLSAQQDTRLALAELSSSQFQLATILGITEIPAEWNEVAAVPDFKVEAIGLTPVDVLRARPDIKRAEAAMAEQAAEFELSKSEMYPKFTLAGTLSQLANVLGNPLPGKTLQLAGAPAVSIPLFDWGQRIARAKQESAKLNETIFSYRQSVIEAMNEANEFLVAHEAAYNNQKSALQQRDIQEKSAALIALEFEKGLKSGIEKEQAAVMAAEAEISAQAALAERASRLASLTKSLGILSNSSLSPTGETHE